MADVAWSDNINTNNGTSYPITKFTYEATLTDTNKDTDILELDPRLSTTIAIKASADTYVVDVTVYLEDTNNASPQTYTFASGVGTVSGVDYIKSLVGPITGVEINESTATASETATIQVYQTKTTA